MKWEKKGLIHCPDQSDVLMFSHAAIPFGEIMDHHLLRIYFSSRNMNGQSLPFYLDTDAKNPSGVKKVNRQPLLELGRPGTFDDNGIMPSCVVSAGSKKYMYYIGWNPQVTVSYRLSIGLALSSDGMSFSKYSEGPICDRMFDEPFFNTAPYVILDNGIWRMWYISCTGWKMINNYPEPMYHVKYAESTDGINWKRTGIVCIDYTEFAKAIGRPCVLKIQDGYEMYYSYRSLLNYRSDKVMSYRLGYATSKDGLVWDRKDNQVGIDRSDSGWDSEMIEYCHVINMSSSKKIMLYNGNGFGKTGIGYAESIN